MSEKRLELSPQQILSSQVRSFLARIFETHEAGEKRWLRIERDLQPFIESGHVTEEMQKELKHLSVAIDEEEFISGMQRCLEPLVRFKLDYPEEYAEISRTRWRNERSYTRVNELLYYEQDIQTGRLILHVMDNKDKPLKELSNLLLDGLRKIARIVRKDEAISGVDGTSWIVARAPNFMRKLGFTVNGEISEQLHKAHFDDEARPISHVEISREELLRRYG